MANEKVAPQDVLLDVSVADASRLYKFYLNQEGKILGDLGGDRIPAAVGVYGRRPECLQSHPDFAHQSHVHERSVAHLQAAVGLFSSGEIYHDLKISSIEFFWGYVLAVVVAVPFGILTGWYKRLSYVFDPFVNAMNATPRVALLPLVIIWLGIGILSKVGIIFLGAVFPMLINARDGVKTTPLNLINAARSFGASEWQVFKSVVFPSTLPFLLTGLRIAIGRALVGVLVGELYAATAGIGFMITVAGATFQTDKVFVGVLIFAISGIVLTEILDRIEHRFDKWRPKVGSGV